ncbi:MAG: PAS domain-containing protein [Bdellovibrionaceae bacterium]|nr:PAS domain-containing protein [Pseudobdellovibrionaceae bacterium]MBX3034483.1 PAS domain-containing protein [Pseudobdellovibrionaceae bacterium]
MAVFFRTAGLPATHFWPVFGVFFAGCALLSAFTSWRFTRPIQRALRKAMRVAGKRYARLNDDGGEEPGLFEDEPGEYSELVLALDRIDKKLKKRKEQLTREREENAAFMSSVQEGLISVNADGRLLYFNSQFAALFLPPSALQPEQSVSLTDAIRVPEIYESFRRVLEKGVTQKVQVRLGTRLDNQPRDFSVSMNPLRQGKTGEIRGVIGIFHDITDIKKAERIRIEFVGNASHELRTPLTSIKGYLETLKEDFQAGRLDHAGNFISIISSNVNRLIELVNDLLSLSALEHHSELQLETVNALMLSDHVVKELAGMAAEKNQVIRVTGVVPPFLADARKVEQVLRNLVSNAIKYIPDSKQIHIRWDKGPKGEIVLSVADNGAGIPEEHHQRLFERFYRIDRGRSRDAGGTGLGLAIVKHIMQSHGGNVMVKSQMGVGSEFICTFPQLKERHA